MDALRIDAASPAGSLIGRALRAFAPVRPGERLTVVLLSLNVFLLLTTYYLLKVVREPLIADFHLWGYTGAELKSYSSAGQTLLLLGVVPAFGWLKNRVSRIRLMTTMQIIFMGCLVGFYLLSEAGVAIGLAFYLWVGIFNVLVISNFWSYANDIYLEESGKRLFALIGVGGSVGAITGAFLPGLLNNLVGTLGLLVMAVAGLAISMVLYRVVDHREAHHKAAVAAERAAKAAAAPPSAHERKKGGFALVLRDRYLRLLALMLFIATVINTTGEYVIGDMAVAHSQVYAQEQVHAHHLAAYEATQPGDSKADAHAAPRVKATDTATPDAAAATTDDPEITEAKDHYMKGFYSSYYGVVNLVSALIQGLLVTLILVKVGVRNALFIMPVIVLFGWLSLVVFTTLMMVRIEKTTENSLDYSLHNTLRQALFLPTSEEAKYKAKAAIDTFFFRMGDFVAGLGVVFLLVEVLHVGSRAFAVLNVGLSLVWIVLAARAGKLHSELVAQQGGEGEPAAAGAARP